MERANHDLTQKATLTVSRAENKKANRQNEMRNYQTTARG